MKNVYRVYTTFMIRGRTYRKGDVITAADLDDPAFVPVLCRTHLIEPIKDPEEKDGADHGRSGNAQKLRRNGR